MSEEVKAVETTLSANMEDYMETIALLSKKSRVVRVKDIARSLNIKMPSVSAALNKLRDKNLIIYEKYGYIELTEEGRSIADKVFQRHSCLTDFLHDILKLEKDAANEEACKLEHYLSAEACSKLDIFLNFYTKESDENAEWVERLKSIMK